MFVLFLAALWLVGIAVALLLTWSVWWVLAAFLIGGAVVFSAMALIEATDAY